MAIFELAAQRLQPGFRFTCRVRAWAKTDLRGRRKRSRDSDEFRLVCAWADQLDLGFEQLNIVIRIPSGRRQLRRPQDQSRVGSVAEGCDALQ
jgi:hypothetical protein